VSSKPGKPGDDVHTDVTKQSISTRNTLLVSIFQCICKS